MEAAVVVTVQEQEQALVLVLVQEQEQAPEQVQAQELLAGAKSNRPPRSFDSRYRHNPRE